MVQARISRFRHPIRTLNYVVSTHADEELERSFGKGAALLVIEAIPLWSCPSCGESCFSAQTMHEIERIKALRKSVAVSRSVPVAAFEAADV